MKLPALLLALSLGATSLAQSYFQPKPSDREIANRGTTVPVVATISYQGYDESQAYFGEGEYEIFLDTGDGVLDKPIIVLDGFDPGDSRDITGLYNSLDFGGQNLADVLRQEGFDIVILNAPQYTTGGKFIDGGADYIQRNGLVLVETINQINDQKVGNEELVVLGPSMGGLIARYALAYMEQNALEHETRLYISFDSPHRGANIPISLQYLINYLAQSLGDPSGQAIVEDVLNSPAAKEMLIDHLLGHLLAGSDFEQDPTKLEPIGAPDFRDAFQAELDALGFPQEVRNVAMINGSGNGTTTGSPGIQVIDTTLDLGATVTADVRLNFTPAAGQTNTATFVQTFLVGIPLNLFTADAESFAFTDGVDAAPGGTSSISTALGDGGGNPVILDFIAALDQDDYSFIPTLSALAIEDEDDWYVAPDIGGIHTSAFVNTYIPDVNEPHVTVTAASAQFALDEIRDGALGVNDQLGLAPYQLVSNPANEVIQLRRRGILEAPVEMAIFNLAGQQVMPAVVLENKEVQLQHGLTAGLYVLQLKSAQDSYSIKLVVK